MYVQGICLGRWTDAQSRAVSQRANVPRQDISNLAVGSPRADKRAAGKKARQSVIQGCRKSHDGPCRIVIAVGGTGGWPALGPLFLSL